MDNPETLATSGSYVTNNSDISKIYVISWLLVIIVINMGGLTPPIFIEIPVPSQEN